jgi:hypothetical protein
MPDTKATALTAGTVLHSTDLLLGVDVTDTTMAASGSTKRYSPAIVAAGLPVFVASGTGHAPGLVPDPGGSAGATRYLREDATWFTPAGGGGGTPGGAAGALQYNNAGAFGGSANWGIGASNTLNGVPIADPGSPAAGDLWLSSGQRTLTSLNSGCLIRHGGCIWMANGAGTAVVNTASPTSLLTGFASPTGSLIIPANLLTTGKILRLQWYGKWSTTATPTMTMAVLLGGTVVMTGATAAALPTQTGANLHLSVFSLNVQAVGASGKVAGTGQFSGFSSLLVGTHSHYITSGGGTIAQVPVDTTAALAFDLQVTWGTASPSNTIQTMGASLYIDG